MFRQLAVFLGTVQDAADAVRVALSSTSDYCSKSTGGPLILFALRSTVTSTRSAILMKGMALFIPYSLRSKAIVPLMAPEPVPRPETVTVSFSGLVTPRMVKSPSASKVSGPVCTILVDLNVIKGFFFVVKEIFAFQLAVLHAASSIHTVRLNLDVQMAPQTLAWRDFHQWALHPTVKNCR